VAVFELEVEPLGGGASRRDDGLVLVVEGQDPAQLDAVITAWLTALA